VWRGSGARSAFPTLSRASLSLPPAMPCFARTAPSRRRPSISVYALERSSAMPASKGVRRTSMLDRREREHAPVSPRSDDTHRRHARPYALHRPSVCCRRRRLGQPRPRDRRLRRPGCAYVSLCGCAILRRMRGSFWHRRLSLSHRARSVQPTASRLVLLRRCVLLCSTSTSAHLGPRIHSIVGGLGQVHRRLQVVRAPPLRRRDGCAAVRPVLRLGVSRLRGRELHPWRDCELHRARCEHGTQRCSAPGGAQVPR
jgi:hypothetical protein